ncbi:MAG: condensation domain-containing protein, partial [Acidimicrobiales bacterium]
AALEGAFGDLIARHAPLRTTFELADSRPIQRVHRAQPPAVPLIDLSDLDAESQRRVVAGAVADALARPFDLGSDGLFQPWLFRLAADDNVVVIRLHHLAFDDWSVDVFRRDLTALYLARVEGSGPPLPELTTGFADFCRQQRGRMAGREGAEQLSYWRRELAGAPLTLALPLSDPARPPGAAHPAAVPLTHPLAADSIRRLRQLAARQRCTLFMALLAVFGVVAFGCTGQDDLVLATVVANRNTVDWEPLVGCFTKKVPLRLRVSPEASFEVSLAGARAAVLGALAHQDLAFETIVQGVLGARAASLGVVPNLSLVFQADTPHRERLVLPGVSVEPYDAASGLAQPHFAASEEGVARASAPTAGSPQESAPAIWGAGAYQGTFLILSVVEDPEQVTLVARGAFHPPSVEKVLDFFDAMLARVVASPGARLVDLVAAGPSGGGRSARTAAVAGFVVDTSRIESALAAHPEIAEVAATVVRREDGTDDLVAYVVPVSGQDCPTPAEMRSFLWSRLPGCPWPSQVLPVTSLPPEVADEPHPLEETPSAEEERLSSLWAHALGGDAIDGATNYWQRFSFLEVPSRAAAGGVGLQGQQVRRNRTLRTLAADLGADTVSADLGADAVAADRARKTTDP